MIVFRFALYYSPRFIKLKQSPTLIKLDFSPCGRRPLVRKSVFRSLHARACGEGCGNSREDGDYHIEDFTPESVVVESSHFI